VSSRQIVSALSVSALSEKRHTEEEVASVVISWLEAMGADVYQEVELYRQGPRADIVARVLSELWIVETKTSMSLALIEQAMERRRFAHRVYIAAPSQRSRAGAGLCAELGIGVISVVVGDATARDYYSEPNVTMRTQSRRWNSRPLALSKKLEPEHKTHARAGSTTGGHWSPFRRTIERLAVEVAAHPGIALKDAVSGIEHHYRSNAGARTSLAAWIREGKVPGVEIRDGKLWPADRTETRQ
jgi:hypothetical protein